MSNDLPKLVIEGITTEGDVFRPSDWTERLLDSLAHYGQDRRTGECRPYRGPERRRGHQAFLQAQICDGHKCLVVDLRLRDTNPAAYRFLLEFIQNNHLRVRETASTNPLTAISP
jgi:hypothetical protein